MNRPPLPHRSPLLRDYELEGTAIGPATRLVVLEADPEGGLFYQFGQRQAQVLQLPRRFGLMPVGLIDMNRCSAILDPQANRLLGLVFFLSGDRRTGVEQRLVLFDDFWGHWLDEQGRVHSEPDPALALRQWHAPLTLEESRSQIGFDFPINIYNREVYDREAIVCFRENSIRHVLELMFHYPDGAFAGARLRLEDLHSHRVQYIFDLDRFPLIWPPLVTPLGEVRPLGPPPAGGGRPDTPDPGPARPKPFPLPPLNNGTGANGNHHHAHHDAHQGHQNGKPAPDAAAGAPGVEAVGDHLEPPVAPPAPAPVAQPERRPPQRTRLFSTVELLERLAEETDADYRWAAIETNLLMGRPERSYALIVRYPDLIAEHVADWEPARLKVAFTMQPGSVLTSIMADGSVNQILALCEDNAESARMMEWLRERELDRLLRLDPRAELLSADQARRALRVDRHADAAVIKKVWRTLLGFMNADHGRSQERAIHRKKDEIAKFLQDARNLLLKGL